MIRKPQIINIVMFGGKKDKKDKDSIKDKTKKKCTNQMYINSKNFYVCFLT